MRKLSLLICLSLAIFSSAQKTGSTKYDSSVAIQRRPLFDSSYQDSLDRINRSRNLDTFMQMQKEREGKERRQMYIRIGLGIFFLIVLVIGLTRKRKQKNKTA